MVWIRIRGSMPLTYGSGSCYSRHFVLQDANKNLLFLLDDKRIRIHTSTNGSGSGGPKNIRIWIHKSATNLLQPRQPNLRASCAARGGTTSAPAPDPLTAIPGHKELVLGIRDVLVRRLPGSVPLTNGSGSGSTPPPDPTSLILRMQNKVIFSCFSFNLPTNRQIIFSLKNLIFC